MSQISWKSLFVASTFLTAAVGSSVQAQEANLAQINQYAQEGASIGQVTSVSQLRDVRPTDWAFQALQSLVERYGCIAGYPDGTYRGNRAMTRYEFAAGLNACLDRVNELIASATADLVTQEDLAVLQRLQEEFQAELATLRGRVDALEARTAELEANQFSTTTKLSGQVTFGLDNVFSGEVNGSDAEDQVTFSSDVLLSLSTSFTGQDLLSIDLQAANVESFANRFGDEFVPEAILDYEDDTENTFVLDNLWYNFPVGKASVYVGTVDLEPDEIVPSTGQLIDDGVSAFFANGNPLSYNLVNGDRFGGAGAGLNYQLTNSINVAAAYLAGDGEAAATGDDNGVFSGDNTAFAQVTLTPGDRLTIVGTYNHAFYSDGGGIINSDDSYTVDAFGVNAGYALSSRLTVDGFFGYGFVESKDTDDDADLLNWAVNLGFPDLFREGNYGGLSVGQFTSAIDANGVAFEEQDDQPLLAQAFYRLKLSDNITIQPGVVYISNPGGDSDNDDAFIGSIRTRFKF